MAELHASSFQVLHGVNQNTAQGLQNVNSTSSFLEKKTFLWLHKMFHLVSNQLLTCSGKLFQTVGVHTDSLTTAGVPQPAVRWRGAAMKGRSLPVYLNKFIISRK